MPNEEYFSRLREALWRATSPPAAPGRRSSDDSSSGASRSTLIEHVSWSPHWEVQFIKRERDKIETWINSKPIDRLDLPVAAAFAAITGADPSVVLPCPFCGGRAEAFPLHLAGDAEDWEVACTACGVTGPGDEHETSKVAAVAAWNKRSPLSVIVGGTLESSK